MIVGLISDTHGLLREAAMQALQGCSLIIHAGDIGSGEVLAQLGSIAKVAAVRGNMDWGDYASDLRATEIVEIGDLLLYVIHDLSRLDLDPSAAGIQAVISGHTHKPSMIKKNGIYYLNPGSAGERRLSRPLSLIRLSINGRELTPQLVDLD
jgi:putative phosphoesterase